MKDIRERRAANDGQQTVMVVDGEILARMAIAAYLRECGYRVIEAVSIPEARTVLGAGHGVAAVLMDVHLPGSEDGFAYARELREAHPEIDVILTSSAAKLADRSADLCDDGPMPKPYRPEELLRRIQLLRERRGREDAPG